MLMYEYEGIIEIEEDLILENPKMQLRKVISYDLLTNEFDLEVYFWETHFKHSRIYRTTNPTTGSLSIGAVLEFVSEHPILGQFTYIG